MKVLWNRNIWTGGKEFIFFDNEWNRIGSIIAETEFLSHLTFEWVSPMDFYRNVVMAG